MPSRSDACQVIHLKEQLPAYHLPTFLLLSRVLAKPALTGPLRYMHTNVARVARNLASSPFARLQPQPNTHKEDSTSSEAFSTPVHLSPPSTRQNSRASSPFTVIPPVEPANVVGQGAVGGQKGEADRLPDLESFNNDDTEGFEEWNNEYWDDEEEEEEMPPDLRPSLDQHDGRQPLLSSKIQPGYDSPSRPQINRQTSMHERDPDLEAKNATRRRYLLASIFLILSLITFAVQTETAVYITRELQWNKSYCML